MKIEFPFLFIVIVLSFAGPVESGVAEIEERAFPVGWLVLRTNKIVLASFPQMEWNVSPSAIDAQVQREDDGSFSIIREALMNVRVIGVSVTDALNGVSSENRSKLEIRMQVNGMGYNPIFFDSSQKADPGEVADSRNVASSDVVDFGARVMTSTGEWSDWYSSSNSDSHVVTLRNGDPAPSDETGAVPGKYLVPYLDASGRIKIGPSDLLVLIAANVNGSGETGFDHPDAAVLVSFSDRAE